MKKSGSRTIEGWADRVRDLLHTQGLTYDDLREPLGVSTRGSVSHYLLGRRSLSAQQAVALADRLDCPLEWMLTGQIKAAEAEVETMKTEKLLKLFEQTRPDVYQALVTLVMGLSRQRK